MSIMILTIWRMTAWEKLIPSVHQKRIGGRIANATFGYQADVDRSEQSYSSPPGAVHLRGVPDSLVHRLCTGNAVYEIVKLHIGRMFFPQWVGTDTLHLLSVIQKFFYFFKSLCNSTSGTMPKTCYINLTITIHKK